MLRSVKNLFYKLNVQTPQATSILDIRNSSTPVASIAQDSNDFKGPGR